MAGPVVQIAPALCVVRVERVDVRVAARTGTLGELGPGLAPLRVQGVEVAQCLLQDGQLPGPAVPREVCGQVLELEPGGGQQLAGARTDAVERCGGVCVTDGGPAAVGVLVEGPAVQVRVERGEGVPGRQDPFTVAQVAVEAPQRGAAAVVRGAGDESIL